MGTVSNAAKTGAEVIKGGADPYSNENPGNAGDVIDRLLNFLPSGIFIPNGVGDKENKSVPFWSQARWSGSLPLGL